MPVEYSSEDDFHHRAPQAERGAWHDVALGLRGKYVGPTYAITWYEGTGEVGARRSPQGDFILLGRISPDRSKADAVLDGILDWGGVCSPFGHVNGMQWLMQQIATHGSVMPDDPSKDPLVL